MCGLAGIFQRDGRPVDPATLVAMTRTIVHRGPDEEGYFLNRRDAAALLPDVPAYAPAEGERGHVGLGHRRLSIIDLKSGQQPLSNEDGTVWIAFNGEIYNFQELKAELEAAGHVFRTHSDTETIVHAYEEWGTAAVQRFRGMFAFALWDERRQRLWIARDRLGKKPLYYCAHEGRFCFGSELKTILQVPGIPRDVNPTAVSDYLSLLYVPSPRTIFTAVEKLPAAHHAVVTADDVRVEPYWDLSLTPVRRERPEAFFEEIVEKLREAVRIRMMSEVPLGSFLSGGIDSSAVVALMAGLSDQPVKTSSISFSVAEFDEAEYARLVAERFGTDHHEYSVTPEAVPVIEKLSWHYDEPFADSSAVPTYYVSKTARENVTVALSGDGGDENFAGYRRYWFDQREQRVRRLPGMLRGLLGVLSRVTGRGRGLLENISRDPVAAYFHSGSAFKEDEKEALLQPELRRTLAGHRTLDWFRGFYNRAPAEDHLSRLLYLDIKTYLCEDILTKVDRASMAVSLEVRCPVLDHEFMELAARIPATFKLRGNEKKWIFKKALEQLLPHEILYRPKMGFGVPLGTWMRGDLKSFAEPLLLDSEGTRRFFVRETIERRWNEHQAGRRDDSAALWTLMMFNLWHRRFVETT